MSTLRIRLLNRIDRALGVGISGLIVGTALGFGGSVWWAPAFIAVLTALLVVAGLARVAVAGQWRMLRSPWTVLGVLALGLATLQSVPVPGRIAAMLSPSARAAHSLGNLAQLAGADDPEAALPEPVTSRTPMTLDRPATLRWLAGAVACLVLFGIVSHYADRLNRLYLVWGSVVGVFLINAAIALVQITGQAEGMYGFIEPGSGPRWAPTAADIFDAPGATALRPVPAVRPTPHSWAIPLPDRPRMLGTLMGGPGALLALGALGLPLALSITLQLMAPRGTRDGMWTRLAESGHASLLILLYASTVAGAFLVGLLAGPSLAIPFAIGLTVVGIPSLLGTGLRWKGLIATVLTLASLGGGAVLADSLAKMPSLSFSLPRVDLGPARGTWAATLAIVRDFPFVGAGLGSFATIEPYYKTADASSTTAMSSALQWWAESGAAGMVLLAAAALWGLFRLPGAVRRVGSADRALVFGMIGAATCFVIFSCVHWTVELPAVALAACAAAGTCNRWLAGGTDLFVERG